MTAGQLQASWPHHRVKVNGKAYSSSGPSLIHHLAAFDVELSRSTSGLPQWTVTLKPIVLSSRYKFIVSQYTLYLSSFLINDACAIIWAGPLACPFARFVGLRPHIFISFLVLSFLFPFFHRVPPYIHGTPKSRGSRVTGLTDEGRTHH